MKTAFTVVAVLILVLAVPLLFVSKDDNRAPQQAEGLPWQIEALPDGRSQVFGLTLGSSTLTDARQRFGDDLHIAIVAATAEKGALEAYIDSVTLGFITGKLILTIDADDSTLAAMRGRAPKSEYMESANAVRKTTLAASDLDAAGRLPIGAIAFIPAANLDEATIVQRFGPPAERIRSSATTEHFLYPGKGLDILLDSERKELLQYVAPSRFERLRAPLLAAKPAG